MNNLSAAAEQVASLMRLLTTTGGLRLKFRVTAGAGAADPDGMERRDLYVECKGADAPLLLERDGELLRALEHVAAKILRLEPEDHDRVSFDVNGFKAARVQLLRSEAQAGVVAVGESGQPFRFAPMSSRERRMLHLFLRESGLQTSSSGEGPGRFVVLYPAGAVVPREDGRERAPRGRSGGEGRGWGRREGGRERR